MNIFHLLLLAFIAVPISEIYVLLEVSDIIGVGYTIILVILTAIVGAALMRAQGLATMIRMREEMARGEPPAATLVEGVMLLFAGALLLTPGFITDTIGFLCLTPAVRSAIATKVVANAVIGVQGATFRGDAGPGFGGRRGGFAREDDVIDGEFSRDEEQSTPQGRIERR